MLGEIYPEIDAKVTFLESLIGPCRAQCPLCGSLCESLTGLCDSDGEHILPCSCGKILFFDSRLKSQRTSFARRILESLKSFKLCSPFYRGS